MESIHLDVYFTYPTVGQKRLHYLILIAKKLLIVYKHPNEQQLIIGKHYDGIASFEVQENSATGNTMLIMQCTDNSVDSICLQDQLRSSVSVRSEVKQVSALLESRVREAQAELLTTQLEVQRYFNALAQELRFGPMHIRGDCVQEKQMLVRYGDIWLRKHNERLVIGVPVFNCTFKR